MRSLNELKTLYTRKLLPDLRVLERERRKIAAKIINISLIISAVSFIIIALLLSVPNPSDARMEFAGYIAIIGIAAIIFVYQYFTFNYKSAFKEKIISKIVKFVDENLHYTKDKHISGQLYRQSQILAHAVNRYEGDDYVSGRIGKTIIKFSELHAMYVKKNSRGERSETIFKGLFLVADFNKNFKG